MGSRVTGRRHQDATRRGTSASGRNVRAPPKPEDRAPRGPEPANAKDQRPADRRVRWIASLDVTLYVVPRLDALQPLERISPLVEDAGIQVLR
jgi:hypothetical protein